MLIFSNTGIHQWKRQGCWLEMLTEGITHSAVQLQPPSQNTQPWEIPGEAAGGENRGDRISVHVPHIFVVGPFFFLPRQPSLRSQDQRPFRYTIAKILLVVVKKLKWRRSYESPHYFSSQPSFICWEEIQVRHWNQIHAVEQKCVSKRRITGALCS